MVAFVIFNDCVIVFTFEDFSSGKDGQDISFGVNICLCRLFVKLCWHSFVVGTIDMPISRNMRFLTMWSVQPAKGSDQALHTRSLVRAFASCLNIL